jgi:hypothetical protein
MVTPQETQRPFAGIGEFRAPHDGQFIDFTLAADTIERG